MDVEQSEVNGKGIWSAKKKNKLTLDLKSSRPLAGIVRRRYLLFNFRIHAKLIIIPERGSNIRHDIAEKGAYYRGNVGYLQFKDQAQRGSFCAVSLC